MFIEHRLSAPWRLCLETTDVVLAQEWLISRTQVPGIEGLVTEVVSSATSPEPEPS